MLAIYNHAITAESMSYSKHKGSVGQSYSSSAHKVGQLISMMANVQTDSDWPVVFPGHFKQFTRTKELRHYS